MVRQIPRSLPYYENTGDNLVEDEADPIVRELMKIRPHKPLFTILSQLDDESVMAYSSKLLELLYLLLEEKQLDDNIRMDLENSLTYFISFIPWVNPDVSEKLDIDRNVTYKNRQSISRPKSTSEEVNPTYPNGHLSKILIDNFDTLIKFSSTYFNLTLSTLVTKYIVELIYQLYYWEVVHLAHINPKIIDFLELIGFEITQTTFGPIIGPPANYLNENLLQGLQYPFPYPFYNYSYHSFDSKVEQKKLDRVQIKPYIDITLKNVDGVSRKKRKGSKTSTKKSFSEEATKIGRRYSEGKEITSLLHPNITGHEWARSNADNSTLFKWNQNASNNDQEENYLSHGRTDQASNWMNRQNSGVTTIPSASTSSSTQPGSVYPLQSPYLRNHPPHGFSPVPYQHYSFQSLPQKSNQPSQQPQNQQYSTSPLLPHLSSQRPLHTQSTPIMPAKSNQISPTLSQREKHHEFPNITPISNYESSQSNILPSISKLTDHLDHCLSEGQSRQGPSLLSTGLGITAPKTSSQFLSQHPQHSPQLGVSQLNKLYSNSEIDYRGNHKDTQYTDKPPYQTIRVDEGTQLGDVLVDQGDLNFALPDKNKRGPRHGVIHQCHLTDPASNTKCLKIFYGKNELLRHQEFVHATKKRIYKCLYCERSGARVQSYPRHDSLARHIRRKHGITGKENKMAVNYAKENVIIVDDAEAANIEYAPEEPFTKLQSGDPVATLKSPEIYDEESFEYERFKQEVEQDKRERRGSPFSRESIALHPASQIPISLPPLTTHPQVSPDFKTPHLPMLPPNTRVQIHSHGLQQNPFEGSSAYHRETSSSVNLSYPHSENYSDIPRLQSFNSNDAKNRLFSIYMGPNSVPSRYTKLDLNKIRISPTLPEPTLTPASSNQPQPQPQPQAESQQENQPGGNQPQPASARSNDSRRLSVKLPLIHDIDNEIGHIYRG